MIASSHRRMSLAGWVVIASIIFAIAASLTIALSTPPLVVTDEMAHLDYAYQVWHGHLPVFQDGVVINPGFGHRPPVQWEAQHPPLFYLILAPVVGPLIDGGHYYAAAIAGRAMNSVIAGVVVFAIWWCARRVMPARPRAAAVAAASASLTGMLILVGGAIYNDLVCVIFAALALGLIATALRQGMTTRLVVAMSLVGAGGMLSRIAFAVWFLALLATILIAPGTALRPKRWGRTVIDVVIVGASAAVAAGWFYVRNLVLTGNLEGGHPEWAEANIGRHSTTALKVVTDPGFWRGIFSIYRANLPSSSVIPWLLLLIPLAIAVALWIRRPRGIALVAVIVGVVVVVVALEVRYVVSDAGGAYTGYGLPLLPIFAVAIGYALSRFKWVGGLLLLGWIVGAAVAFKSAVHFDLPTTHHLAMHLAEVSFVVAAIALGFSTVVMVGLWAFRAKTWGTWDSSLVAAQASSTT